MVMAPAAASVVAAPHNHHAWHIIAMSATCVLFQLRMLKEMTEPSFPCTERLVSPYGNLSRFRFILVLIIMSFDTLGTVKADTNETALQGNLIRYGEKSAQIAFATGGPTAGRPSRVESCWSASPFLNGLLRNFANMLYLDDLHRAPKQQTSDHVGRPGKRYRLQRVRLCQECCDSKRHSREFRGTQDLK